MWRGGLERRRRREIDKRRIDRLSCKKAGHDVGWSVSDATIPHGNHVTAIGLQCVARIELGKAVVVNELPVGAAGQYPAFQLAAFERATNNRHDAADTSRRPTDLDRGRDLCTDLE